MKKIKEVPADDAQIIDCYFICDKCGRETDHGILTGCGRTMLKLCYECVEEINKEGEKDNG